MEKPKWIAVSDELPDADTTVLTHKAAWDEPVWMGWLDGDTWRDVDAMTCDPAPTHWMNFPEPPEAGRKAK